MAKSAVKNSRKSLENAKTGLGTRQVTAAPRTGVPDHATYLLCADRVGRAGGLLARSARPAFLYVMYSLIVCAVPVGVVAAFDPARAEAIGRAMGGYLAALPDALYALLGTGYLGYTAARQWGKVKGVEA